MTPKHIFQIVFLLITISGICLPKSVYSQSAFFMRFESPNIEALRSNIDESYKNLSEAEKNCDDELSFQISIELSEMLTIAGREREAVNLLEPLLKSVTAKTKSEDQAWFYLNYATANQYLSRKDIAQFYFKKALKLVLNHKLENTEHYVLHHYARFLVEIRNFKLAKRYFEKALKIRKKLNDSRIDSTQKALNELKLMNSAF